MPFGNAEELSPEDSAILLCKGEILAASGHTEDALGCVEAAIKSKPSSDAFLMRAYLQESLGRKFEAFADYSRVLELMPNNTFALEGLNRIRAGV